jgi:hypothetical protein
MGLETSYSQILQLAHVDTFIDCMMECINLLEPAQCIGITWNNDTTITAADDPGGLCWMFFNVDNPGPQPGKSTDVAILQSNNTTKNQSSPTVYSFHMISTYKIVSMSESTNLSINQRQLYHPMRYRLQPI